MVTKISQVFLMVTGVMILLSQHRFAAADELGEDTAIYTRDAQKKSHPALDLINPGPKISSASSRSGLAFSAVITGTVTVKDISLLYKDDILTVGPSGEFTVSIPIVAQATEVEMYAVSARGDLSKQMIGILVPSWQELIHPQKTKPPKTRFLSAGISFSQVSVSDSRVDEFEERAVTGKLSVSTLLFSPHWDAGVSGYFTLLPFSANRDDSVRFLGLNLRVGYIVPAIQEPWQLSIQAGFYYTTMFVKSGTFGFQSMAGPQLFPVLRRHFKKGDSASAYLKFSPVTSSFSLAPLTDRELAAGVSYMRPFGNGHTWGAAFDVAQLSLVIEDVTIVSRSYSLGAVLGL